MRHGRIVGAISAQILGQVLTGATLLAHVTRWPDVSLWVVAFLIAAALVPFRHDGTWRDRAAGNFGAALVLGGFLWWDFVLAGLDGLLGDGGAAAGLEALLTLTATALFAVAGSIFWLAREREGGS